MRKNHLLFLFLSLSLLLSACGEKTSSTPVITPTQVNNSLGGSFNPNSNIFLNDGCPECQFQNPATQCDPQMGIYTPNGTCITNPSMPGFGQNQQILNQYSNAAYACGANPYQDPYMQAYNPYNFYQGCQQFSNYYPVNSYYMGGYPYYY